jgi:serine phosphatase RsbU (regulator of sigma subunit)
LIAQRGVSRKDAKKTKEETKILDLFLLCVLGIFFASLRETLKGVRPMSHSRMLNPTLELVRGGKTQRVYEIKGADFHIGRLPNLDVFIDDNRISRPHARVHLRPDGSYELVDLGSQNGTYLEGKRLTAFRSVRLRDGDRIKIIDYELVFHQPALEPAEPEQDGTTVLGSLDDLSSARLGERAAQPAAAFAAILDVIRALGGGVELDELLDRALGGLMAVFPKAERGFIVRAEDDGSLPFAAVRNRQGPTSSPTLSRTIRDHVLREGKAILISDVSVDEVFGERMSVASSVRSAICVPLLAHDGRRIGMVQLDRRTEKASFRQEDLDLLAALVLPIGVAVENDRLLKERASWAAASGIQQALLPRARPEIPDYAFWECYRPALEVGGDLYDYIAVERAPNVSGGESRWAVTLGDVAGKGMPAALIMAGICPEVRHLVRAGLAPHEVLARVNRHVYDNGVDGRFVTLVITEIDPRTHELTIASAGHQSILVRRAGSTVEEIVSEGAGPPLGAVRDADYRPTLVGLEPGDVVVLYSDGLTDALDQDRNFFGLRRLRAEIAQAPDGAAAVGESILAAVRNHFAGRSQFDDITIVCFGRDGECPPRSEPPGTQF